jgi:purine-nucleoside phosphorylase
MDAIRCHLLEESVRRIRQSWPDARPALGIVLGSGWDAAADGFDRLDEIPYQAIPGLEPPLISGHRGALAWTRCAGTECFIFHGQHHAYQGLGWTPIALPIYVLRQFNAAAIVLTNAAGAINPGFEAGQLMMIADHINLMGLNPLCGEHSLIWGERFPDLSQTYDSSLRSALKQTADELGEELREGVYCACLGPSYETPAEIRMMAAIGADAVGMSTVPSAILAKAAGLRVLGISCLSNAAPGTKPEAVAHNQVVEVVQAAAPRMRKLLSRFVRNISAANGHTGAATAKKA